MKIERLAELLVLKYKLAVSSAELESSVRHKINVIWTYANKQFNILRACADSNAAKPKNADEKIAVAGYLFCKELLSMIDYLKSNSKSVSLGEIRELIYNLVNLINENKNKSFNADGKLEENNDKPLVTQFMHVSGLIYQMIPITNKNSVKLRNEQYNKARTGLSRILSLSLDIIKDLDQLEVVSPEKFKYKNISDVDIDMKLPERFKAQRAIVSENDIIDFIRQYGDTYGISSTEDWGIMLHTDPQLKEQMTTIINAINRGHRSLNALDVKMEIARIIKEHEERKSNNAPLFEDVE